MTEQESIPSKTVLEYMVMINKQSYSGIGRDLSITPQQFSDWIKKRRPIPQERLQALAAYFAVDETYLVDSNYYARSLTPMVKIELHMLLLDQEVSKLEAEGADEADIAPYREKKIKLQYEQVDQHRLGRVIAIIEQRDQRMNAILDRVLDDLEAGLVNELSHRLEGGDD